MFFVRVQLLWYTIDVESEEIMARGRKGNKLENILDTTVINNSTGCWEWQGCKDRDGYGTMGYQNQTRLVHRLAYMLFYNTSEEDIKGKVVMHKCDNPSCINPEHIKLTTQRENIIDMHKKGRAADQTGEKNGNAKLTDYQVKKIREMYQLGISQEELSKIFNVSRRTIYNIRNGISWSHVSFE